jgi:hypothetical protein
MGIREIERPLMDVTPDTNHFLKIGRLHHFGATRASETARSALSDLPGGGHLSSLVPIALVRVFNELRLPIRASPVWALSAWMNATAACSAS